MSTITLTTTADLKTVLAALEQADQLATRYEDLERENEQLREDCEYTWNVLDAMHEKMLELQRKMHALQHEKELLERENASLAEQRDALKESYEDMTESRDIANKCYSSAANKLRQTEIRYEKLKNKTDIERQERAVDELLQYAADIKKHVNRECNRIHGHVDAD